MKYGLFFILFCFSIYVNAQQHEGNITFSFSINKEPIELGKNYYLSSIEDSVQFETLKLYISNIQFFNDSFLVHTEEKKHHLIDLENPSTQNIQMLNTDVSFNRIQFNVGVDSLTNVSGAAGDDLDPMHGMYWTWQSGYINFKLEGRSNSCPARKNRFQFHLGGYQHPFNNLQEVTLSIADDQDIIINLDLEKLLTSNNIKEHYEIMSPNQKALDMARILASTFSTK